MRGLHDVTLVYKPLSIRDFVTKESGGLLMTEEGRKKVLVACQRRKDSSITHPYLEEKTTLGRLPRLQALLLARHLRGDLEEYPAFVNK